MRKLMLLIMVCLLPCAGFCAALIGPDGEPVVVRGIGWSPWHYPEGWGLSEATRNLDRQILHEAHINTLRHWGPDSPESVKERMGYGFYTIPTLHCHEGLAAEFETGTKSGISHTDTATRDAFVKRVREDVAQFDNSEGVLCFLLGNEYSGVGQDSARNHDYFYKGFEISNLEHFRNWLKERFGTLERMNQFCNTSYTDFSQAQPLATRRMRYEFWLHQNRTFEDFMQIAHEAAMQGNPECKTAYAKLMGTHWDPYTEDVRLSFLSYGSGNEYWDWTHDWATFNNYLNDLIAAAPGKSVILTESGFQSRVRGPEKAARLTKQLIWNTFMHPQMAGVCIYAYSDEWYVDGNDKEQSDWESWGVVTADRQKKPQYFAMAQCYKDIEAIQDDIAIWQDAPQVTVSNQALDNLVADASTAMHHDIARLFYSNGIAFRSAMPFDLLHLDPVKQPRLILCDQLLNNEPDGSADAVAAIVKYIRDGGQVLYLSPKPWQVVYGQAQVPVELQLAGTEPGIVKYGKGMVQFVSDTQIPVDKLKEYVWDFLQMTGAQFPLRPVEVVPAGRGNELFCRILSVDAEKSYIVVVNAGDTRLPAAELDLTGYKTAKLRFGDGASLMTQPAADNSMRLSLRDIDTYAVIELNR